MNYMELCIDESVSVRNAMRKLDKTSIKNLFVIAENKLLATLTDGDIRRFLLSGGKMDDLAYAAANHYPKVAENQKQAQELFKQSGFLAIPIIDKQNKLIDIYIGIETETKFFPKLNVPVVIMAGGKGTRLDPYTRVLPKPLIPVGDLPIIEHIMQRFSQYSCDDFHIIVNYKKQLLKAYFNENEQTYKTTWYDEEKPLGTGGGLYLLKGKLKSTFFLTNCDVLLQSNYDNMLHFHQDHGNAITMICAYKNLVIPYGVVEMGKNGSIEAMKEKPEMSFLTNTGMYIVEPAVIEDIQDNAMIGFPDIIERQKKQGRKVAAYPISENEWLDMGQMKELEDMRKRLYGE